MRYDDGDDDDNDDVNDDDVIDEGRRLDSLGLSNTTSRPATICTRLKFM